MRKFLATAFAAVFMVVCLAGCTSASPEKTDADYYKEYMELESTQAFLNDMNDANDELIAAVNEKSLTKLKSAAERMEGIMDAVIDNENVPEVCEKMNKAAVSACKNGKEMLDYFVAYAEASNNGNASEAMSNLQSAGASRNLVDIDIEKFNEEHERLKLEYE